MTPAARVQAAIEVLDLVIAAARDNGPPADRIISDWLRPRRYAGSGDRRAVRALAYAAIRACGEIPPDGRAALLRLAREDAALAALFDGARHAPAPILPQELVAEGGVAPAWLSAALAQSGIDGDEALALLERAPLDVRINTLKAQGLVLPLEGAPTPAPNGLRFAPDTPVEQWPAWSEGRIEVQDAGSQLMCEAVAARPGETVIDLCAGAGGKTLALGASMRNTGRLYAFDVSGHRLDSLKPRLARSGLSNVHPAQLAHERDDRVRRLAGKIDRVLVDAPCSGLGTLRRNPDLKWRQSPASIAELQVKQIAILSSAARLLKPGGRLVYATCSLLPAENEDVARAFGAAHPDFAPLNAAELLRALKVPQADTLCTPGGAHLRLWPHRHATDGFFAAIWQRKR